MIIKIENKNCNGYSYYSGFNIEYEVLTMKEVKALKYDKAFWAINEGNTENDKLLTAIFYIYPIPHDIDECRIVITTRLTYILNDQGKTIDRIL